jgi:hypothetical protein
MASYYLHDTAIATHTPESHALLPVTHSALNKLKNNEPAEAPSSEVDARDTSRDVNVDGGVDSALGVPPAAKQTVAQGRFEHSLLAGPIAKVLALAVDLDDIGVTAVPGLLLRRGPPAIVRGVGAVVVNPVNRMSRGWPWPHVGEKMVEAIRTAPPLANRDTALYVVPECLAAMGVATSPKTNPYAVFGSGLAVNHDVPPASTLREKLGAGAAGMRFSGATLALRQRTTSDRERQG